MTAVEPNDGDRPRTARMLRMDALFDLLVARVTVTIYDIMDELRCNHRAANEAVHDLRMLLAYDDTINLVATPQGPREPWLYSLEGSIDPSRPWITNRIGDSETRVTTINAVCRSLVSANDGRSIEGRKARVLEMGTRHIMEQIHAIDDGAI